MAPSSLDRRQFIAATSAAALSRLTVQGSQSATQALAAHTHPDVQIDRVELPRDENAFWLWQEATRKLKPLDEFAAESFQGGDDELDEFVSSVTKAQDLDTPFPDGDAAGCVRSWLKQSQPSLDLIERGIEAGRFQIPRRYLADFLKDNNSIEDAAFPREIERLLATLLNLHLRERRTDAAFSIVADLSRVAAMLLEGDGFLIHYIVALAVNSSATKAYEVCATTKVIEDADGLRTVKLSRPKIESLGRVFRIEFVYFIRAKLAELPTVDLTATANALVEEHMLFGGDLASDEDAVAIRDGMLELFRGHPSPLHKAETVRLYSNVVAAMIQDLSRPWRSRRQDHAKKWLDEIKSWPRTLWYQQDLLQILGEDTGEEEGTLSDEDLATAREALHTVRNPIGKLMLKSSLAFENTRRAYETGRLRADIAMLMFACRKFRDANGRLPERLEEVVDLHFIPAVPHDPFSGKPVQFDAGRGLVWSVGINGTNEGGVKNSDDPEQGDLVWRLPASWTR